MSNNLLAEYDKLCMGFNSFLIVDSDREFLRFAKNLEACRQKWFKSEEINHFQNELQSLNSVLELQVHHLKGLLKNEITVRTQLANDKEELEQLIWKIVYSKREIRDEICEELLQANYAVRRYSHGYYGSGGDRLSTIIEEVSSIGVLKASFDISERTEEELELSVVRSYRASARQKQESRGLDHSKPSGQMNENILEVSGNDHLVATTTATTSQGGSITAKSIIEDFPQDGVGTTGEQFTSTNLKMTSSTELETASNVSIRSEKRNKRQHVLKQKIIIKLENCSVCGNRIKFGKPAMKCNECRSVCHVDCNTRLPIPCVATAQTPFNKSFFGTVPLESVVPNVSPMVPAIIIRCIEEIEHRGLSDVGICGGNEQENEIKDLKDRLLREEEQPQIADVNINVITGTLEAFLRELKEPLIPFTHWDRFFRIADMDDMKQVENVVSTLVQELPQPNRDTLAYLILHLQRVAGSEMCQIPISDLAKVSGPTIIGYHRLDPDPEMGMKYELLKKQYSTMEKLLSIPREYWESTIAKNFKREPTYFTSPSLE